MSRIATLTTALLCVVAVSGCSRAAVHSADVSRPVPNSYVLLVPELQGGWAGWNLATGYRAITEGTGPLKTTSTGPIFAEGSCEENKTRIHIYALTTSEVAAVSVAGGTPIPTTTNSTLPDGLRAAAVEVLRRNGHPNSRLYCPRLTPLGANGKPIIQKSSPGRTQAFILRGVRVWEAPAHPPNSACEITATRLPPETITFYGYVTSRIRPYRGLLGKALLSCVSVVYLYNKKYQLTAAVLLNALHPGTTPPWLPGMKPLLGHAGIFKAPGARGETVTRRIPGAWLVVEEEDRIGLRVPIELLEQLRATIRL
jgi:hypothetical protein